MTPHQRLGWKFSLQDMGMLLVCLGVSSAAVFAIKRLADWNLGAGASVKIAIVAGFALYVGWTILDYRRLRKSEEALTAPQLEVISFDRFKEREHAIIAPNHQHMEDAIRDWLSAFVKRHGAESVFIVPSPDEPHLCDKVFLLSVDFTDEERDELLQLGADGTKILPATARKRFFPTLDSITHVLEVLWD
jgi:hypothetical protein